MKKDVIIIFGPTGVGKSKIAVEVAKEIDGEIISCDSMQIYKKLNIGTAKISEDEKQGVPHYLIDIISPNDEFSVGSYVKLAEKKINEILIRNKTPIIVGGTGLYIKSLINSYDFGNVKKDEKLRAEYKKILEEKGNKYLHEILQKKDENMAKKIHFNDTKKVIRALEIIDNKNAIKIDIDNKKDYNYILFGLFLPREKIYEKINERTEEMFRQGLVNEVKELINDGVNVNSQSMQGIGYKEILFGLKNNWSNQQMINLIQQKTRNYAKRQLTFMRGFKNLIWIDALQGTNKIIEVLNDKRN